MSTLPSSPLSVILNVLHRDGSWFSKTLVSQLPSYFWNSAHVFLGERDVEQWIYLSYKCIITLLYISNNLFLLKKHNLCKEMKVSERYICMWYLCMNVYMCMRVAKISMWPKNGKPRHLIGHFRLVWTWILKKKKEQLYTQHSDYYYSDFFRTGRL